MLRIVIGVILGFAAAALGGKVLIPFLRRMKAGQSIKEIGPTWHMSKQGTPTMGGLMFIIAAAAVTAVLGWPRLYGRALRRGLRAHCSPWYSASSAISTTT